MYFLCMGFKSEDCFLINLLQTTYNFNTYYIFVVVVCVVVISFQSWREYWIFTHTPVVPFLSPFLLLFTVTKTKNMSKFKGKHMYEQDAHPGLYYVIRVKENFTFFSTNPSCSHFFQLFILSFFLSLFINFAKKLVHLTVFPQILVHVYSCREKSIVFFLQVHPKV